MSLDMLYFVPDKVKANTTGTTTTVPQQNVEQRIISKDGSIEKTDFAEIISELKEELFQQL